MKTFTRNGARAAVCWVVGVWVLCGVGCASKVTDDSVRPIAAAELHERLDDGERVLVLDARDLREYAAGRVPGSRHVRLPDVPRDRPVEAFEGYGLIVVYGSDPSSGPAVAIAKRLIRSGTGRVRLLEEGFAGWRSSGLPVEE